MRNPRELISLIGFCTIVVGGLLGFTAIGLYAKGWLQTKFGLIERFHIPVLAGGIVLIAMVLLRAIAVRKQAHRGGGDDVHGHGKSESDRRGSAERYLGWAAWQYPVLIIPVLLFFLGLPAAVYKMTWHQPDLIEPELEKSIASERLALAGIAGSAVLSALKKNGAPLYLRIGHRWASRQKLPCLWMAKMSFLKDSSSCRRTRLRSFACSESTLGIRST